MKPIILLPVRDHINGYLRSSLDACGYPWLPVYGSSDLPRVRSVLLTRALAAECDPILCIDADIVADASDIRRLAEHPRLSDAGAVTGLYAVRSGEAWACKLADDRVEPDGCRRAEFAGLGFSALTAASLERVRRSLPVLLDPDIGGWWPFCVPFIGERNGQAEYCPDDVSLWRRLESSGTQLWADPTLVVGHQALVTLRSPVDQAKTQVLPNLDLMIPKVDDGRQGVG
jgi:hypothetical protein